MNMGAMVRSGIEKISICGYNKLVIDRINNVSTVQYSGKNPYIFCIT